MSFVGLDVGGTFIKAARLTPLGVDGSVTRLPVPPFIDTSGAAREIDPAALMHVVAAAIDDALKGDRADGILITGQMAGLAFTDVKGFAVSPVVSWQDMRATDTSRVFEALSKSEIDDLGETVRVGLPLLTLRTISRPAGSYVQSLLSFVSGALCDSRVRTIHTTDAASWGMVDVRAADWSELALRFAELDRARLPKVSTGIVPVGTSPQFSATVFTPVGDQQAALLGAGLSSQQVSVNLATGCQVSIVRSSTKSPAQLRPYFGGQYLHTITHLPAGRLLTAALFSARGSIQDTDWEWAQQSAESDPRIAGAVAQICDSIVASIRLLDAESKPILFSGGVAQQFRPIRDRITKELSAQSTMFDGDDAALQGLSQVLRTRGISEQ